MLLNGILVLGALIPNWAAVGNHMNTALKKLVSPVSM